MNFREFLKEEMGKETFDIGKDLEGDELKTAIAKANEKCKKDHRGVKYNKETGFVTFS